MRGASPLIAVRTLLVGALLAATAPGAIAQTGSVQGQIGAVADVFEGTPNMQGLLPTAVAEAAIAAQHVELANAAITSLPDVRLHVGHALHAIDPTLSLEGPGLGYGARPAVRNAVLYIETIASDSTASENARTHTIHISAILASVSARLDRVVSLAQEIESTSNAAIAASLLGQLTAHVEGLTVGADIDRDGRIGWQAGEGGLRQATQHMTLLKRGEGLIP